MYGKVFKRLFDFTFSFLAFLLLSPLFLLLIIIGAIAMRGNPFFCQERPGKNEKVFRLIKFRTMSDRRGSDGELLPDDQRLNGYGKILRATSLDELPELLNIIVGQMAIVGPRPLLPRDVTYMNAVQKKRHTVRPGLTGLAQCHGRNRLNWDEKLDLDVQYVEKISFKSDIRILFQTIAQVWRREGVEFDEVPDMDLKDWNEMKKTNEAVVKK